MIETLSEILSSALIVVGAFFLLVGSYGLVKLPGTMRRLHAPTKATTLGVGSLLLASMIYFGGVQGHLSFHELLVTLFLFLTAPVSAHMIAKAHILRAKSERKDLPRTGTQSGWATLVPPEQAGP